MYRSGEPPKTPSQSPPCLYYRKRSLLRGAHVDPQFSRVAASTIWISTLRRMPRQYFSCPFSPSGDWDLTMRKMLLFLSNQRTKACFWTVGRARVRHGTPRPKRLAKNVVCSNTVENVYSAHFRWPVVALGLTSSSPATPSPSLRVPGCDRPRGSRKCHPCFPFATATAEAGHPPGQHLTKVDIAHEYEDEDANRWPRTPPQTFPLQSTSVTPVGKADYCRGPSVYDDRAPLFSGTRTNTLQLTSARRRRRSFWGDTLLQFIGLSEAID